MNNVLGRVHIVANTAGASFCICFLSRYVLVAHRLFLGCSRYVLLFSRRLEKKKIIDPNRRRRTGSLNRRLHPFRWRSAALGRNETNCSARWLSQSSWNLFHLRRRRIQRMGTCSGSWRGRKVRTACQWKQAEHPAHLVYSLLLLIGQNWLPLSRQCIPPTSLRPVRISRLYNGTYRIPKKAHQHQLFLNFARVPIFLSIHVEKINRSAPPSLSCRFVAVILCTVRYIYSQQGRGRLKILTCSASPGRVRHLQPHQVDGAAWARKLVT